MLIFPAIDILGGKAVRLLKGDYDKATVYNDDPYSVAKSFRDAGCDAIHIVDLDGAREGSAVNMGIVRSIARIPGMLSEIGGGIRNMDTVCRYLDAGISRVILGTAALEDPRLLDSALERFGNRIAVGVDLRDGMVAVRGWLETSSRDGLDFIRELESRGVGTAIVTDISRDGAMKGPNLVLYRAIASGCSMDITASGGVSTLDDLRNLKDAGVYAAIIGKAYYSGAIRLEDALEVAR